MTNPLPIEADCAERKRCLELFPEKPLHDRGSVHIFLIPRWLMPVRRKSPRSKSALELESGSTSKRRNELWKKFEVRVDGSRQQRLPCRPPSNESCLTRTSKSDLGSTIGQTRRWAKVDWFDLWQSGGRAFEWHTLSGVRSQLSCFVIFFNTPIVPFI